MNEALERWYHQLEIMQSSLNDIQHIDLTRFTPQELTIFKFKIMGIMGEAFLDISKIDETLAIYTKENGIKGQIN